MRANQLMDFAPCALSLDTSLEQAARYLLNCGMDTVPVVDGRNGVAGSVSRLDVLEGLRHRLASTNNHQDSDLILLLSNRLRVDRKPADDLALSDVMKPNRLVVSEHTPDLILCSLMLEHRVDSIPIVRHERVIGQVTCADLLRHILDENSDRSTEW